MIIDSTTSFAEDYLNKVQKLQAAVNRKKFRKLCDDIRKSEQLFITRENGHVRDVLSLDGPLTPAYKRCIAGIIVMPVIEESVRMFKSMVGRASRLGLKNRS